MKKEAMTMDKFIKKATKKSFSVTRNLIDVSEGLAEKALDPKLMRQGAKVNVLVNGMLLVIPISQLVINQKLNSWGIGIGLLSSTSILVNSFIKKNKN